MTRSTMKKKMQNKWKKGITRPEFRQAVIGISPDTADKRTFKELFRDNYRRFVDPEGKIIVKKL